MARPVILATFANDRYGPTTGYLRDLVGERRAIERALAERRGVELVVRGNVTLDEWFDLLGRYGERLVVWHHGGHAEADGLFLESARGEPSAAHVAGLAARLGQLERLRLVVLNGCSTAGQVGAVHGHCTAPIVATARAIEDAAARDFAGRLFADLAADRTLADAFTSAAAQARATAGPTRLLRPSAAGADGPPWGLHLHPEHRASAGWRLSDSVSSDGVSPDSVASDSIHPHRWRWIAAGLALALLLGWALIPRGGSGPPVADERAACDRAEVCNGRDDDCDEATDEAVSCGLAALAGGWGAAACVEGACRMTACPGGWHDIDGDFENGCEYACTPTGEETCNAIDDDCDGIVDDLMADDAIATRGPVACDLYCDGVDDDGDGRSDEGCPAVRCGAARPAGAARVEHAAVPPCNGCPDGVEVPAGWVCIPPGEATLGAPPIDARWARPEGPERRVVFERPFLMMATEVTRAQWAAVAEPAGGGARPSYDHCAAEPDDDCPVDRVSWFDGVWFAIAQSRAHGRTPCSPPAAFAGCEGEPGRGCPPGERWCGHHDDWPVLHCMGHMDRLLDRIDPTCDGYRLPTADEWEYAARAGASGRAFAADVVGLEAMGWIRTNAARQTHPVGGRAPNRWGLYDMLGNVAEPVHDRYPDHRGGDIHRELNRSTLVGIEREGGDYRLHRWGLRLVRPLPAAAER